MSSVHIQEIEDFYSEIPLLKNLDPSIIWDFAQKSQMTYYPKNSLLFQQALSPLDGVYIIIQGTLELSYESNEEIEHDFLGKGDVYGAISLLRNNGTSLRTVTCKQDCFFSFIPKASFSNLCKKFPEAEKSFYNPLNEDNYQRSISEMRNRGQLSRDGFMLISMKQACRRPLSFCSPDDKLNKVAQIMSEANFGFCMVRNNEQLLGVISDSDLRRSMAKGDDPKHTKASLIMSSPAKTIPDNVTVLEALLKMERYALSHLPGIDENGEVSSVLSALDLPQVQNGSPLDLIYQVRQCKTHQECKKIKNKLPDVSAGLLQQGYSPSHTAQYISRVNDAILRVTIKQVLEEIGSPPCPFDFVVLGSEGRLEQTLSGDQDNALIYEDNDDPEIHNWFKNFAALVCGSLDNAGYIYCKGRIMAENDEWCQPLSSWKSKFGKWISQPHGQNLLNSQIFFDFRHIYGPGELSIELRNYLNSELRNSGKHLFRSMTAEFCSQPAPLGFFNNFIIAKDGEHKNSLDIKTVMNFFAEFARVLALEAGIHATSTHRRLMEIHQRDVISSEELHNFHRAWDLCLYLRLQHQIDLLYEGKESDNFINPDKLNSVDRQLLRSCFKLVPDLQLKLKLRFNAGLH